MKLFTLQNKKFRNKILPILFWIAIWEIISLIINRELYLPSPYAAFTALIKLMGTKTFWVIILTSIYRVIAGFIIAAIVGTITAIACGLNQFLYNLLHPLVTAIKSTPVMSFIIIALIWFSSGNVPIFICFLMCYPIFWTSIVEGMRQVDKRYLQMASLYNVKKRYIIMQIYFPTIEPYLMAGMLSALGLGWKVAVAAEVLSHPKYAIGSYLHNAKIYLESDQLFAWTIVVIFLSMFFEAIIGKLFRYIKDNKRLKKQNAK